MFMILFWLLLYVDAYFYCSSYSIKEGRVNIFHVKYLIELLMYVFLFIFAGCDNCNNMECDVNISLLGKHMFIINSNNIYNMYYTVEAPVCVTLSSVVAIIITSMICSFVMWKKQMSYKGIKSPIYDTPNCANIEKQCFELKDNIFYGEIKYIDKWVLWLLDQTSNKSLTQSVWTHYMIS